MRNIIILFILLVGMVTSQSFAQYQVNYLHSEGETMTFRVVGYGKNAKKASADAEINAVKGLLFKGIPNTQQSVPMIKETEQTSYSKNKSFWNAFWEGEYQNVITRSVIVRNFGKDENKQKSITLEVTVNTHALRQDLERNSIIRKFGL
ncbi:MAG: hypothetical protein NC453_23520 [Muribaculum sp.]|nr:hypothetical protein [Muribaculum sp.]